MVSASRRSLYHKLVTDCWFLTLGVGTPVWARCVQGTPPSLPAIREEPRFPPPLAGGARLEGYPLPTSLSTREGVRAGDGPKTERSAVRPLGRPRHALPTANLWVKGRDVGGVRPLQRIKYPVGAACSRPFAASQTRGDCAAAPTHDFVGQALDPYCFESALVGTPTLNFITCCSEFIQSLG